ncbi:hypothetical protein F4779DRAFT_358535 [Xylariaceae sp. FL0662B]|nr:hypothetical protein F4779DRAFT_358535 [Xylariaceae sp. FL0662B]
MMDPTRSQPVYAGQYQQPAPILPFSNSWYITKLVFESLSLVLCALVVGISVALAIDPRISSYIVVWTAPQAGVGLVWTIAELATIWYRRCHRGIYPGAHVAVHLMLWLGFSVGLGLTAYILAFGLAFSSADFDEYYDYYNYYYKDGYYYNYYSRTYVTSMEALVAFLGLLIIVHLLLFVRACIETAQRNSTSTQVIVMPPQQMYYASSTNPGIPMHGSTAA